MRAGRQSLRRQAVSEVVQSRRWKTEPLTASVNERLNRSAFSIVPSTFQNTKPFVGPAITYFNR